MIRASPKKKTLVNRRFPVNLDIHSLATKRQTKTEKITIGDKATKRQTKTEKITIWRQSDKATNRKWKRQFALNARDRREKRQIHIYINLSKACMSKMKMRLSLCRFVANRGDC